MFQPAMAVGMIVAMAVIVVMMIVVVVVVVAVVIAGVEKFRLEFENAVEIERAALQHIRQCDLAALGAMQLGIGADCADPRLDFIEFGLAAELSIVQDDVF